MVFDGVHLSEALATASRLLEQARQLRVQVRPGESIGFTISIGVASFPDDGSSAVDLIRSSDERMYRAKQSGRDRVVSA
jgi:diguanylate cyclase (GGDEF)-like protein